MKIHNQLALRVLPEQLRAQPSFEFLARGHSRAHGTRELRLVLKVHVHGEHVPAEEGLAIGRGQEEGRYLAPWLRVRRSQRYDRISQSIERRTSKPILLRIRHVEKVPVVQLVRVYQTVSASAIMTISPSSIPESSSFSSASISILFLPANSFPTPCALPPLIAPSLPPLLLLIPLPQTLRPSQTIHREKEKKGKEENEEENSLPLHPRMHRAPQQARP